MGILHIICLLKNTLNEQQYKKCKYEHKINAILETLQMKYYFNDWHAVQIN